MAAAATAAAQRARKKQKELQQKEKARQQEIKRWFHQYDENSSGVLEREQLKQLLIDHGPKYAPEPDDACLDELMKQATAIDTTGDGVADTCGVKRDALEEVINSHYLYVQEKSQIDAIFRRFDTNQSGVLEKDQLLNLMKMYGPDVKNISQSDVDFVLEKCDVSATGTVLPSEVLPAIAIWKELVKQKTASSSMCALS